MKKIWSCAAAIMAALIGAPSSHAAEFPDKPVKMIVGFVPGGGSDISARILADILAKEIGQSVVVENKPGASSTLAVDFVSKSQPNGYTVLHTNSDGITLLPALKSTIPYSVPNDFSYISRVLQLPLAITVNKDLPVNSIAELVEYARKNPGKVHYGSSGIGSGPHMAALLLAKQAGIKMVHVPYKGSGGAINDLLGGHLQMALPAVQAVAGHAGNAMVKVLAVTGPKRDPLLPDVPTIAEAGYPDAQMVIWYGLMGPPNLPANVLKTLQDKTVAALTSADGKERYKAAGFETDPLVGDDFKKFVEKEFETWKSLAAQENLSLPD
ncbi:tripartite tricarboxylate transporter substrate binding protein [Bosea sp. (in: a-proteobacteria)]|uniref:Bug family tripartite tricarboxylate transporter substrate binding protein n=1 Tax=Bosea sp. (in: a-proteobacteria) TaxID=1871050 RepID=UPI00260F4693|nr:tripartite tricarboxylate transporter substrate binding protein [Bosea sp. (in: a-proteobacteria)]MCO5091846.1 tripartite tricarboxylate transporter substrate binding protein [Bosea sp. (in: a-proteobacteria)]